MRRIGIDFDNTIVGYDAVFCAAAIEYGLLPPRFTGSKREVRDILRRRPDGELVWQRLQGEVYGKRMFAAVPIPGVLDFLAACRDGADTEPVIVSHKTEFGHHDPDRINLRDAARTWLAAHGVTAGDNPLIDPAKVWFEPTREDKIARIKALGCEIFIDDLEEVLTHPEFPVATTCIQYTGGDAAPAGVGHRACATWSEVTAAVFGVHG